MPKFQVTLKRYREAIICVEAPSKEMLEEHMNASELIDWLTSDSDDNNEATVDREEAERCHAVVSFGRWRDHPTVRRPPMAEEILDMASDKCGWSNAQKVQVLLEYIEKQQNPDAFEAFIDRKVAEEQDL
jgi:hypothetical protein